MKKKIEFIISLLCVLLFVTGCVSTPSTLENSVLQERKISRKIMEKGVLSSEELYRWFMSEYPDSSKSIIKRIARYYVVEADSEGVNSDVAFAQMCLETGYLKFGNLVKPEMHNYCGLGATDKDHPGEWFKTERLGVRAHIQHLQAYGTTLEVELKNPLVDPRYSWPHKARFAEDIYGLANTWAMDPLYGEKINAILDKMASFANVR